MRYLPKGVTVEEWVDVGRGDYQDQPDWRIVGIYWPAVWASVKYWLCVALVAGVSMLMGFSRV